MYVQPLFNKNLAEQDDVNPRQINQCYEMIRSTIMKNKELLVQSIAQKVPNPDGIPAVALRSCAGVMTCLRYILFSKRLSRQTLSGDWVVGYTVQIH